MSYDKWKPRILKNKIGSSAFQSTIARVKFGNKNQKWVNYPDTPSIIVSGTVVDSEHFPYQAVFSLPKHSTYVAGTYLYMAQSGMTLSYDSGLQRYRINPTVGLLYMFILINNNEWYRVSTAHSMPIVQCIESNADVINADTGLVYFSKSTTPTMDYSPLRWAIRPVYERVE